MARKRRRGEWVWTTPNDMEAVRESRGLKPEAFAGLLGFSANTYATWVDGTRVARPTSQRKIAKALEGIKGHAPSPVDDEPDPTPTEAPGNREWMPPSWSRVASPADGAVRIVAAYLRATGESGKVPSPDEVVGFTQRLLETLGGK